MKLFKYGLPLAALAVMASCSNDNIDAPAQGAEESFQGSGLYLNVSLSMPTDLSGRAYTEAYEDGKASEYALEDGKLFIFSGTESTVGSVIAIINLPIDPKDGSGSVTKKLEFEGLEMPLEVEKAADKFYYALAVLNTKYISLPAVGTSWDEWATDDQPGNFRKGDDVSDDASTTANYFTMTNALGWEGSVTNNAPTVPVKISSSNLYYKSEGSSSATAINIYVQRLVAKVSITDENKYFESAQAVTGTEATVKLDGWRLDYTNPNAYPVQTLGESVSDFISSWNTANTSSPTSRFFGTATDFVRFHWGIDPNYDTEAEQTVTLTHDVTTAPSLTADAIAYCNENTMAYDNQYQDQSTRVIFKGTYYVDGSTTASSFVTYNGVAVKVSDDKIKTGQASEAGVALQDLYTDSEDEEIATVAAALNITVDTEVNFHKEGVSYYYAIIRHFENDQLGLADNWELKYDDYTEVPTTEGGATHLLGRFGVVRNNWYDIQINSVNGPGEPEIPTPDPNTPDDPKAKVMLDCNVNILKWTKRSHGYDL